MLVENAKLIATEELLDEAPWKRPDSVSFYKLYPYNEYRGNFYSLLEDVEETAYNEVGDVADGWFSKVTRDQEEELINILTEVFENWMFKYNHRPYFYSLEEIECVKVEKFLEGKE